jgi:RNA ligase
MNDTDHMRAVSKLVADGVRNFKPLGDVAAIEHEGLVLLNYTPAAQYNRRWNYLERVSRGLILDGTTGEVVARPFDKFFNWGEVPYEPAPETHIVSISEKMDGSLGILYRHKGEFCVATRTRFVGTQARWATEFLRGHYDLSALPSHWTLLFEIIYPENRIVVDYGAREDLVLLAARDRHTGEYMPRNTFKHFARGFGFSTPYDYSDLAYAGTENLLNAAESLSVNREGFVIAMSDGTRWKIKGSQYVQLHKLLSTTTFHTVLEAMQAGNFDQLLRMIPDEWRGQLWQWHRQIEQEVRAIKAYVEHDMHRAPTKDRKLFAQWVQNNVPRNRHAYMFAAVDGKPIAPMILKRAFKDRAPSKPLIFSEG